MNETATTSLIVRWLRPEQIKARWEPESARLSVRIENGEEVADARAALAFPMSGPGRFVDVCDAKNESLGMVESLEGLDGETRKAIEAALKARYMIPQITRILELVETSPFVLRWRVETNLGGRVFFTESTRESVRYHGLDRIRVTDLAGNHHDIPSIFALDPASRGILGTFL